MIYLFIAFFLGMFTNVDDFRADFTSYVSYIAINIDSFLGYSIFKLQALLTFIRGFMLANVVDDAQSMKKKKQFLQLTHFPHSNKNSL